MPWYWLTLTVIIIVLLLVGNLERSRVGRAWIAIREDEDAAEIMGVPTFKYKVWAFVIGAGGRRPLRRAVRRPGRLREQPEVRRRQTSMLFLCAVVLGGTGNKVGAILGGALVAYIPLRFTAIADYKYLIFGLALVLLMIFRRRDCFPARQRLLAYGRSAYNKVLAAKRRRRIADGRGRRPRGVDAPPEWRRVMTTDAVTGMQRSAGAGHRRRGPGRNWAWTSRSPRRRPRTGRSPSRWASSSSRCRT